MMLTCNQLDLQTLGSQPVVMPTNLPDHWFSPITGFVRHLGPSDVMIVCEVSKTSYNKNGGLQGWVCMYICAALRRGWKMISRSTCNTS